MQARCLFDSIQLRNVTDKRRPNCSQKNGERLSSVFKGGLVTEGGQTPILRTTLHQLIRLLDLFGESHI